ncbi:MAG: polyphosphate kinase 1 [Bernardetiaceae bacterium]
MNAEERHRYIQESNLISRDLSWLQFNCRVLEQAERPARSLIERLKFLAITASNLDEFFMIRVGSLYNYLDYGKERVDYSGLLSDDFREVLLTESARFVERQEICFRESLMPQFEENGFSIVGPESLNPTHRRVVAHYFDKTIFPMLTPMVYDGYHAFPILRNQLLIFGIVTQDVSGDKTTRKVSFVQIPRNLPRFFELEDQNDHLLFVPIEEIIRLHIEKLFRNVKILSANLFRITRNGDYTLEESDDLDTNFVDELKHRLKTRQTGRVVRVEIEPKASKWLLRTLKERWEIDNHNIVTVHTLLDLTGLWQIVRQKKFQRQLSQLPAPIAPVSFQQGGNKNMFERIRRGDIFLHHPYHSFDPVIELLEQAAVDPNVLAIKMTIYRLAKDSRISEALLEAAENGKHVSVLFEVKARFDEENNIKEAKRLQKAGCFVIYGISNLKTHTKLLLIVRKEEERIGRYIHFGTGNYNESTARLYTDIGILTANEAYAQDVSEFFNVITGHSEPIRYQKLLAAPVHLRDGLIDLIDTEIKHAEAGLPSGIIIKVNSLQDRTFIEALYRASAAGVRVHLIVRGICCIRPGRAGLSQNIEVRSIVGDLLEHSRLFYFHNNGKPYIYTGSADAMARSFIRRVESLFLIEDPLCRAEAMNILLYNLKDNQNSYLLQEDGRYIRLMPAEGEAPFNIHQAFFEVTPEIINQASTDLLHWMHSPSPVVSRVVEE